VIPACFPGNIAIREKGYGSKIIDTEDRSANATGSSNRSTGIRSVGKSSSSGIQEILRHNRSIKPISSIGRRKGICLRIGHSRDYKPEEVLTIGERRNSEAWGEIHNRQLPIDSVIGEARSTEIKRLCARENSCRIRAICQHHSRCVLHKVIRRIQCRLSIIRRGRIGYYNITGKPHLYLGRIYFRSIDGKRSNILRSPRRKGERIIPALKNISGSRFDTSRTSDKSDLIGRIGDEHGWITQVDGFCTDIVVYFQIIFYSPILRDLYCLGTDSTEIERLIETDIDRAEIDPLVDGTAAGKCPFHLCTGSVISCSCGKVVRICCTGGCARSSSEIRSKQ